MWASCPLYNHGLLKTHTPHNPPPQASWDCISTLFIRYILKRALGTRVRKEVGVGKGALLKVVKELGLY